MGLFAYGFETRCFAPQTISPSRQISPHEMSQTLTMFCLELPAGFQYYFRALYRLPIGRRFLRYLTEMMMDFSLLRALKRPNSLRQPRRRADFRTWSFLIKGFFIRSFDRTEL